MVRTFPPDGVTDAPVVGGISLVFDREADPVSVEAGFSTDPPLSGSWVWGAGRRAIFIPSAPLAFSTPYSVQLGPAVRAADGSPLASAYAFGFRTRPSYDATVRRIAGYALSAPDGNLLYTRLTEPVSGCPCPGIVLVPAGLGVGSDWENYLPGFTPEEMAAAGIVVADFVPEGRGSTCCASPGPEGYDASPQQDDLHAVLTYLSIQPGVDPNRLLVVSYDFGLVMAAGALAAYAQPVVYALFDVEGPSDRQTATDGGTVPLFSGFPLTDDGFWRPREPDLLLPAVPCAYFRFQALPDHLLGMDASAALADYRAAGLARWRRMNDVTANAVLDPNASIQAPASRNGSLLLAYLLEIAFGPSP